jgi:peptide/nickel transport system substrate-binding protein
MEQTPTAGGLQVILYSLVCLLVLAVGAALGYVGDASRKGGTLRVATTEPPTLDGLWRTEAGPVAQHYLEGLYSIGQEYGPTPMLAVWHTVSDDGLVYTFTLRRGVQFHHGKELTAADAVASLQRWGKFHPFGKDFFTRVAAVMPLDRYTLQIRLYAPTVLLLSALANGAFMYPKDVLDEAGDSEVKRPIGTGPFKVAEYHPGDSLTLVRFAQYQARPEPPNGYGGGKTAWVDTLRFVFLPDPARLAAVASGDVDVMDGPPYYYDHLTANPDLTVHIIEAPFETALILNKKQGVFTNVQMRQAILAALDMDALLRTGGGNPKFYYHDASLEPKASPWWTDVGRERYNQPDRAKARRLLQEAGYQGQPVRYMATRDAWLALPTKQQLEDAGFTVDLQVMDGATVSQRITHPDLWDAYQALFPFRLDPIFHPGLRCDSPFVGWNCDPDFAQVVRAMETERQFEKRYRFWQDIQRLFWERVPYIHYGHASHFIAMRKHVHGRPFDMPNPYFWNVWVEK